MERSDADLLDRPQEAGPVDADQKERLEAARKRLAEARAAFDKQYQCAIVGGPVVVRGGVRPWRGGGGEDAIFVAVAKGPNAWNWGYLSECVVYGLSSSGEVLGMATLPRMVKGGQFAVSAGGLVWGCEKGALVRLAAPPARAGFGPGGADCILGIDWYRQYPPGKTDGWLTADKAGDVIAFDDARAYRAVSGGYVAAKEDRVYRFPLSVVDLKTGSESMATLAVPFNGDLPLPKTNFSTTGGTVHADGPYLMGVTLMHVDGRVLEVTVGVEGSAVGLIFDAEAVRGAAGK
jgi:hypothetical protein